MNLRKRFTVKQIMAVIAVIIAAAALGIGIYAANETVTYTTKAPDGEEWEWNTISETTDESTGITTKTYGLDTDADEEYEITLVCSGNQWDYYFDVADENAKYYVTEILNNNLDKEYTLYDKNGNPIGFETMEDGSVTIYNIADGYGIPDYGSIKLSKALADSSGNTVTGSSETFAFDLVLMYTKPDDADVDITPFLTGSRSYGDVSVTWSESDGTYTASARISLKAGESIELTQIPAGVGYEITEATEGYEHTWTGDSSGTIEKNTEEEIVCTNIEPEEPETPSETELGKFIVRKTVVTSDGKTADDDETVFLFRASVEGLESETSYYYMIYDDSGSVVTVTGDDGNATKTPAYKTLSDGSALVDFTLKNGQYAVFSRLPIGTSYQIVETGLEGYTASYEVENYTDVAGSKGQNASDDTSLTTRKETLDEGEAGKDTDESVTVHFTNTKPKPAEETETTDIGVRKVWKDGNDSHTGDRIIIQLMRATSQEDVDGNMGDMVDTVALDGTTDEYEEIAWQYVFTDLDVYSDEEDENGNTVKYIYYVTEAKVNGYSSAVTQDETPSGSADLSFTVTNTMEKGEIILKKYDDEGNALSGVEYKLYSTDSEYDLNESYEYDGETYHLADTEATDENGKITFGDLLADGKVKYIAVETKTKEGMQLLAEPVDAGTLPMKVLTSSMDADYSGMSYEEGDYTYCYSVTYEIRDDAVLVSPDTGSQNGFVFQTAAAVIVCLTAFYFYKKFSEKKETAKDS